MARPRATSTMLWAPSYPSSVAVGDVNADGKPDIVTTNYADSTVSILLGNGNGTFQGHVDYPTGSNPASVTTADFNKDGKLDLAVADNGGISVLPGRGDGSFPAHVEYSVGGDLPFNPFVMAGDFNQDGTLDLAATSGLGGVSVLLGNGDSTFQSHANYATAPLPGPITA